MTMKLQREGREYSWWPLANHSPGLTNWVVKLTLTGDEETAELITDPEVLAAADITADAAVRLLVKGPDFVDTLSDGLGILVAANCRPYVRCTDTPEVVIRRGASIELV